MFLDEHKIKVVGGAGGDGCMSFRREKFVPKGGPDGGDAGNGGDIIIKVNTHLNTLSHMAHKRIFKAERGGHGLGKNMHGANASHLIIEVPLGTIVYNADKSQMIADLNHIADQVTVAKGGKGGLGNSRFKTSTHQAPRFAETGEPGETTELTLELKMVADVGIIGLPSAGKSTLISVISNARPKIAAYHFTTLTPNLGVVNMSKFGGSANDSFVVADIPGLIEGASEGKGLGHQFLKHISRTALLVHLVDASHQNPKESYKTIIKELKKFDKDLGKKQEIIVINKIDLLEEKEIKKLKKTLKADHTISALTHEGLKPLMFDITKQLQKIKKAEQTKKDQEPEQEDIEIHEPHLDRNRYVIDQIKETATKKSFYVSGKRLEQMIIMTNLNNTEGLERVYRQFEKTGLQKELKKRGAKLGDCVRISSKSIPFRS
ncbi:GTPase ObgE [Patescibacteria group bacterium]|nr:GTPase ObgE [Patescibacteria group bacterium]